MICAARITQVLARLSAHLPAALVALTPGLSPPPSCGPPPCRRDRPGGSTSASPSSTSDTPTATVDSEHPAARATAAIPPRPSARAWVPRYTRH